jgi:cytochrome c2
MVGPPLAGVANRVYLGGVVTNTPENMIAWIVDPRAIDPQTAMPVTGISAEDARDVTAYLYTLR